MPAGPSAQPPGVWRGNPEGTWGYGYFDHNQPNFLITNIFFIHEVVLGSELNFQDPRSSRPKPTKNGNRFLLDQHFDGLKLKFVDLISSIGGTATGITSTSPTGVGPWILDLGTG